MKINIPAPNDSGTSVEIDLEEPLLILGANGTGKSRLGARIEREHLQNPICHRISAQRALQFPDEVSPRSVEKALQQLLYGHERIHADIRQQSRWGNKPTAYTLNDFQALLLTLFSEDYEVSTTYRQEALKADQPATPPSTKLDRLKEIWERVHPHRELTIGGGTVAVRSTGGDPYKAAELSDGERVTFYLIGQILCVPEGSIIVVDEPEIHLHSAIQTTLWDEIESSRPDCGFVFITHDLDFASTRIRAQKLWLNSYDGTNWDWSWIPEDTGFPENLLIQLLGSRRPILFVEGERESWDSALYTPSFPQKHVVAVGSCSRVISFTKAFNALQDLHHNEASGIIDRDYRTNDELATLEADLIHNSNVAEVDNLACMPTFVEKVAVFVGHPDPAKAVADVSDFIVGEFERMKDVHALQLTFARVRRHLGHFASSSKDLPGLKGDLSAHVVRIDVDAIHSAAITEADALIASRDVQGILKVFNHKGLLPQIGTYLGLQSDEYEKRIKHFIHQDGSDLPTVIQNQIPNARG